MSPPDQHNRSDVRTWLQNDPQSVTPGSQKEVQKSYSFDFFRGLGPQVPQEGPKDPQVPSKGPFVSDFRPIWRSSGILGHQNDAQSGAERALKEVSFGIVWVEF